MINDLLNLKEQPTPFGGEREFILYSSDFSLGGPHYELHSCI